MKKFKDGILLYSSNSLEEYLRVKSILVKNNIYYYEQIKSGGGGFEFFVNLFINGTGSRGMNSERITAYCIYVKDVDYEKARYITNINQ